MVNGGFAYGYLFMSQHQNTPNILKEFLTISRPNQILEIGTLHGGLTMLIRDILDSIGLENSSIRTYDINEQEFLKPLIENKKIEVYTKNLFNDNYTDWSNENSKQEIYDYLHQNGTSIVMCDGGCKKCEFKLITPLLKNQDIIMAHDYAPNHDYFETFMKDKIWDWHEIQDADILDVVSQYSLIPYHQELMQDIAWCSKQKSRTL